MTPYVQSAADSTLKHSGQNGIFAFFFTSWDASARLVAPRYAQAAVRLRDIEEDDLAEDKTVFTAVNCESISALCDRYEIPNTYPVLGYIVNGHLVKRLEQGDQLQVDQILKFMQTTLEEHKLQSVVTIHNVSDWENLLTWASTPSIAVLVMFQTPWCTTCPEAASALPGAIFPKFSLVPIACVIDE